MKVNITKKQVENIKRNAIEIPNYVGLRLDEIVTELINLRKQGKLNYFALFNGVKLYSIDVTMDESYKKCFGCTKRTFLKRMKALEDKLCMEREDAIKKVPYWIEEGKKYIQPEKIDSWKCLCIEDANGPYFGGIIDATLKLMKMLEENMDFEVIEKELDEQNHSGNSFNYVMDLLLRYTKKGGSFYKYIYRNEMTPERENYVNKILVDSKYKETLDKEIIAHICSLCILFRIKYNKSIYTLEMLQFLEDVMNFDEMQIYLLQCETEGIKLTLNDKLKKLFEFKSNEEILSMYDTLQNFDEDNIATLKRNL